MEPLKSIHQLPVKNPWIRFILVLQEIYIYIFVVGIFSLCQWMTLLCLWLTKKPAKMNKEVMMENPGFRGSMWVWLYNVHIIRSTSCTIECEFPAPLFENYYYSKCDSFWVCQLSLLVLSFCMFCIYWKLCLYKQKFLELITRLLVLDPGMINAICLLYGVNYAIAFR